MEVLTEKEIALIVKRLEELVADLEQDVSARTFYTFVILAQDFAGTKKALCNMEHIRTLVSLAQRMRAIRNVLLPEASHWTPLYDVLQMIQSEATTLTRLYRVARPACGKISRDLQREFRASFKQETGKEYQAYGKPKTAKERATITAFWEDALRTALARFQHNGEAQTLDRVMACLPAWASRQHERWSKQGWREPSAQEVMHVFKEYVMICDVCMGTIAQIAGAVLEHAPVVDRAQVTREVEQRHTEKGQALREKIRAIHIPKEAPKEQKATLRKEKEQLNQELQELLSTQEVEIKSRANKIAHERQKLETLAKKVSVPREHMMGKVGKAIVDALARIIWIYDFERQGDEDRHTAKKEAKSFFRKVLKARAKNVAVDSP